MSVGEFLENIGKGVATGAKVAGAVLEPLAKRTAEVVSGDAPQLDYERRNRQYAMEDQQIAVKAKELENQMAMGEKYGTLTPEQRQQYVDQITGLYSHPRHAGTLMEKLRQAVHPKGAVASPSSLSTLKNAMPEGGTAAQDERNAEKLAMAKASNKPLPKDAAFLQAFARERGKTWAELTPDELLEAFNQEGETKAAQQKEEHLKALEEYRNSTLKLRKSEADLHEAQFKASQDPNNPAFRLKLEQARSAATRNEAYMINAQARAFGSFNGTPLPGAALTAEGQPIGSGFASNVKPTSQEISRADLAASALEQISDMKKLLTDRSSMFGPGAGRVQKMQQWIGSQDPDAQRFTAAATTAADHLMGVFGGRSSATGLRIEAAMGELKTNPEATIAALDQFSKAAETIQSKGTRHVVGGVPGQIKSLTNPPGGVVPGKVNPAQLPEAAKKQLKEGQVTVFGNGQEWTLQNGQPKQVK